MITKTGGVVQLFLSLRGGHVIFILVLGGVSQLYLVVFYIFKVCLLFVFHAYIIHRFILSPYSPTIIL